MEKSRHDKAGGGMGGRLRQRLAQILLHSSCATTSAIAFVGVANNNAVAAATIAHSASRQEPPLAEQAPRAHEPRFKRSDRCQRRHHRHRSTRALVHISIDCSAHSVGAAAVLPAPMPANGVTAERSKTRKGSADRMRAPSYVWSSSTDTDGELAPFSSDGDRADTRSTLFSSRSFSSDSTSDFYNTTGAGNRSRRHKQPPRRAPPKPADAFRTAADKREKETSKTKDDGKDGVVAAAGSVAVVKRSHNPYADFRSSMVEMVAGRGIRGVDAMGELLVWYLSLNSPRHHPTILAAFEDVWETVLGNES